MQVVDVEGTGSSWHCSKCNEAVLKERVDQVRYLEVEGGPGEIS